MRARNIAAMGWVLLVLAFAAVADSGGLTFTTLSITPFAIEGAQSDGDRRDNSPRTAGEVNGGAANPGERGKISCADQRLNIPGLPLPVH